MTRFVLIAALGALLLGCGATLPQLKKRAAFDLQCPEEQIQVVQIDKRTRGVQGCGKQGTYVESCKACGSGGGQHCDCTWILNSSPPQKKSGAR